MNTNVYCRQLERTKNMPILSVALCVINVVGVLVVIGAIMRAQL